jgi:hypothetical protein
MENVVEDPAFKLNFIEAEAYLKSERQATEKHE